MKRLERFENLKDEVERAIRPFIKVKVYLEGDVDDERLKELQNDKRFQERVERLTLLFLKGLKEGFSVLIVPVGLPEDEVKALEKDEHFLSRVEEIARSFEGDDAIN